MDTLDGSGDAGNISKLLLNIGATQVMFIDYQWLGAGRVRFGFNIDGKNVVVHEFRHANTNTQAYMRTGTLPLTMEQYNYGTPASPSYTYIISASVKCEGKFTPRVHVQSATSEPPERFVNGSGLTVDTGTTAGGVLVDGQVVVVAGGTNYAVGERVLVTGGNATLLVATETAGVVDTLTVQFGGTGYSDASAVPTITLPEYQHLWSARSSQLLSGKDNRAISIPQFIHIVDTGDGTVPYLIEFVKNDTLGGTVIWIDQYAGNAIDSTNPTLGGVTSTTDGEVLFTMSGRGETVIDMQEIFGMDSQIIIRKADINLDPDHYTLRVKPVSIGGDVTLMSGMTWKEIR